MHTHAHIRTHNTQAALWPVEAQLKPHGMPDVEQTVQGARHIQTNKHAQSHFAHLDLTRHAQRVSHYVIL